MAAGAPQAPGDPGKGTPRTRAAWGGVRQTGMQVFPGGAPQKVQGARHTVNPAVQTPGLSLGKCERGQSRTDPLWPSDLTVASGRAPRPNVSPRNLGQNPQGRSPGCRPIWGCRPAGAGALVRRGPQVGWELRYALGRAPMHPNPASRLPRPHPHPQALQALAPPTRTRPRPFTKAPHPAP